MLKHFSGSELMVSRRPNSDFITETQSTAALVEFCTPSMPWTRI